MAKCDLESMIKESVAVPMQAIATDTTTNSAAIDMQGYESLVLVAETGAWTDGTFTMALLEGDDTNISNASAVADADLLPTGTGQEASAALGAANSISKVGYRGTSRYVFVGLVSASTTTGATVGVKAIQGHPANAPVA